ncbi:hypothetical protein AC578_1419 [Pseudocercospora eumusae]|uniref:Zn(2)-C6 fungal-type domain-containing protein n=1 Tax=Pseudocercospora eumusae TaxID=321146 RepID=A0A139HUM1_9PEZI|nr:hypothetical protein AC578_1419 [Pseudocercospora eumusae]
MAALSPVLYSNTPSTTHASPTQPNDGGNAADSPRAAKRQKVTRACDSCKSRKRRCTGELPCSACHANGTHCTYLASYTRGRLVQPQPSAHHDNSSTKLPIIPRQIAPEVRLEPVGLNNGAESNARTSRAASPEGGSTNLGQYLGPTSPYTFLRRAWKRFEEDGAKLLSVNAAQDDVAQSDSVFSYGDRQAPQVEQDDHFRLPDVATTSLLLAQYFDLAMPTYRFLHQPTIAQWLATYHQVEAGVQGATLLPIRQAVVLVVLATARLINADESQHMAGPDETSRKDSERFFNAAQARMTNESGKPRLESIQARLAKCLFLLHTSRPNRAWYEFGTTIQLIMALGLHRASNIPSTQQDHITRECRKRCLWAASTLDTYLSVILGRPALIHLEDIDQRMPDPVEDEDLTAQGIIQDHAPRDSVIKASILHAEITRIVKKAVHEQYSVERKRSQQKLETAAKLNAETAEWHASLPVVLSGAIHPSSLIPIFRRQITVLQLAHCHAQMMINRPSLLLLDSSSHTALKESQINTCLSAAKSTLHSTLAAGFSKHTFQSFWYTQFVSFTALTVIYVWLIQRKHGAAATSLMTTPHEDELRCLAETVQKHLMEASQGNAPSLRYSIVLEELQQEVQRPPRRPRPPPQPETEKLMEPSSEFIELDPDLFLSLDCFPFADFGIGMDDE